MPVAKSGAATLAYEVRGDAAGPPVVLVIGLGVPSAAWRLVADELVSRGLRVATFDNRGTGGSSWPPQEPYTISAMANDVLAVADACGFARFHLVGHSLGGMVAQEVLVRAPVRVRTLTLVSTGPGFGTPRTPQSLPPQPTAEAYAALTAEPDPRDARGSLLRSYAATSGPGFRALPQARVDWLVTTLLRHPVDARTREAQLLAATSYTASGRLPAKLPPVLIVHGGADPLLPPGNAELLARKLAPARLVWLEGAGHPLWLLSPERLAALVSEHVGAERTPAPR